MEENNPQERFDFYKQLGIHDLRRIAMAVGVRLPTKLKVDELIRTIIDVEEGRVEPYVKATNKGRPSKTNENMQYYLKICDAQIIKSQAEKIKSLEETLENMRRLLSGSPKDKLSKNKERILNL